MERRRLLSTLVVTDAGDDASVHSLRWAIQQADGSGSSTAVMIDFNLPAGGPVAIRLSSPLPEIDVPIVIDGTTQPGYQGSPLVEIDGSGVAGSGNDGLVIAAGGSVIRGLSMVGFSGSAIVLAGESGNAVASNYLGLTPSGASLSNHQGLTLEGSSQNTIGIGSAGLGNVISGNSGDGILIMPGPAGDSTGNLIVGNAIGTSPDGMHAAGNGIGIIVGGSGTNQIGMPGQAFGNVISGNAGVGISVTGHAAGTLIQGNAIGVAADRRTPLGNQGDGIRLDDAPGTLIGGPEVIDRNIISANLGNGIATYDDTGGLVVANNAIGTDATGTLDLGNLQNGVCLATSNNTIGGGDPGSANLVEFNGSGRVGAGVQLVGPVDHNTILSNTIVGNAGLGINFGSGPTPNHAPGTAGPNDYQNYPVLLAAEDDGLGTTINGSLNESPNAQYTIQFFSSPHADPSGYGQGKVLLGSTSVQTDAKGSATFSKGLPSGVAGQFISATATDAAGNTSEFSAALAVLGQIDLVVTGSAAPDPVVDGADLTYTFTVANRGTADAHSLFFNDLLPAGVSLVSVSSSQGHMMPEPGAAAISVYLGTVPAGSSATVTIVAQTGAGAVGTIVDTGSVTGPEPDPHPELETATVKTVVLSAADLSIAIAGGPSPALAGGDLTYTMTVTNLGPQAATNARAVLPLAPGLAFVSARSSLGSASLQAGQVVAGLGDLAAGGQATVTVVARAMAACTVSEQAAASSDSFDRDPSNNTSAVVTTEVDPASALSVAVTADTAVAATGVPFRYTVTVANAGPCDATGVVLTETLPAGVTVISDDSSDPGMTAAVAGNVLSVTFELLAAGTSASLTIAVEPTAPPGSTLVDSVAVRGDQADPDTTDNADSLSLSVRGVSDLAVTAAVQAGPYYVGQGLTYTIAVTNNGPADEPDAVLSGPIPPGAAVIAAHSSVGADPSVIQGLLTADLGPLPKGKTAVVTLVVAPGPSDAGAFSTSFSVRGQDYDPDPTDNESGVGVTVAASCDLGVAVVPGNVGAMAEVDWSYTVRVTNSGPSSAAGVQAAIPIPAGARFVSAAPGQGTAFLASDGVLWAELGTLASGASGTVTVVIDPTYAVGGGTIALSAQVAGGQHDPNPANNGSALGLAVAPSVAVALGLSSTSQVVPTGQFVTFTATVRNVGASRATGVVVAFPQVGGLTLVSSTPSQGTLALVSGVSYAHLGDLAPGASATVVVQELAVTPGTYSMAARVAEDQYNLDQPSASAALSAQVVESAGILQFGVPGVQVTDQSGLVAIPVVRLYGASGTVTVHYQTAPINATPGVDYTPTAGTLTLGPGQWGGWIQVPILDDPYLRHDTYLNVALDSPTAGAVLGQATTAQVHIRDVDPDLTPPQVSGLSWAGTAQAIAAVTIQFTAPLDPAFATDVADYHIVTMAGGQPIAIASIAYDPMRFAVTLVPQSPMPSGLYYQIQVVGAGASAVRDAAGNLLDGAGNGTAGTNYSAYFAQGSRLTYRDHNRNTVRLAVRGPGYLQQVLDSNGNGVLLHLVGMVPHRTALRGHIRARRHGSGQTELGVVTGLGQLGDVRVRMKTPPFRVEQLPFQRNGRPAL